VGDDARQLGPRAHDHLNRESDPGFELSLELLRQAVGRDAARQHHVAALKVRADVLVAVAFQELAQVGHPDTPAAREVDPAQEDDSPL
jgi:hypothetical protein